MADYIVTLNVDNSIALTQIIGPDPLYRRRAKLLFELSRTTDKRTVFNPELHSIEVIASGIVGHRPLEVIGECTSEDLPDSRDNRDNWVWDSTNNKVIDPDNE